MKAFNIGNLHISNETPPLVIPEIGINHGGSLEVAKLMVDSAINAGAKIIKHQTHIIEDEMSSEAKSVIPGNAKISIYEIMKKCALSYKDELALKEYAESKGLIYLSTPFSRAAANRLNDMGVLAFKIGSGECNNYPLLKHIAGFKKPIILSTGMNSIESIAKSVEILRNAQIPFVLLHTTNLYPTPPNLVRLNAMIALKEAFDCLVGLSDHSISNLACLGAVALGACVVERHFTDTMERRGPDIICSMDEFALRELITQSKEMFILRGSENEAKVPTKEEQVTIDFAFASVVSIAQIKKGEVLSEKNIWVKRPSKGGISAEHYESLLGKVALRDIPNDTQIKICDIGE
ncbi:N-acetylneuraminate synthase family protein [Helicobacter sp. 23-1044]